MGYDLDPDILTMIKAIECYNYEKKRMWENTEREKVYALSTGKEWTISVWGRSISNSR